MKFIVVLFLFLAMIGINTSVFAKDCGSNCKTCYCKFKNGSVCDEDHSILGTCTCTCVKYKKKNKSADSSGEINDMALQEMINDYLVLKGFNYRITSAEFENEDPSGSVEKGLFGKNWKCRIVPNGISCTGK